MNTPYTHVCGAYCTGKVHADTIEAGSEVPFAFFRQTLRDWERDLRISVQSYEPQHFGSHPGVQRVRLYWTPRKGCAIHVEKAV